MHSTVQESDILLIYIVLSQKVVPNPNISRWEAEDQEEQLPLTRERLLNYIFPAKHYGMIYHLQRTCSPAPCCRWPWPQSTSVGGPPPDAACSGWCSLGRQTSTNKQCVTVTRSFWHHNQAWIKMADDQFLKLAEVFFFLATFGSHFEGHVHFGLTLNILMNTGLQVCIHNI